jgi:hypothetical protein
MTPEFFSPQKGRKKRMRTYAKSFLIGAGAVFVLLVVGLTVLGMVATLRDWKSLEIAIGPIRLFSFAREGATATTGETTTTSWDIGIVLVAAFAGLVATGATAIRRRRALSV